MIDSFLLQLLLKGDFLVAKWTFLSLRCLICWSHFSEAYYLFVFYLFVQSTNWTLPVLKYWFHLVFIFYIYLRFWLTVFFVHKDFRIAFKWIMTIDVHFKRIINVFFWVILDLVTLYLNYTKVVLFIFPANLQWIFIFKVYWINFIRGWLWVPLSIGERPVLDQLVFILSELKLLAAHFAYAAVGRFRLKFLRFVRRCTHLI